MENHMTSLVQTCNCCGQTLSLDRFDRDRNLRHGRRYTCKACARIRAKESRLRLNRETNGLYGILKSMKRRCFDPKHKSFSRYGGRGITICGEWLVDQEAFYSWANANGYQPGLQIDRIDNDGNYEPKNCRWVSPSENMRNSNNAKLDPARVQAIRSDAYDGVMSQRAIARRFGVCQSTVSQAANGKTWR